jgi:hypothetical protein
MKSRLIFLSLVALATPAFAENWRASSASDQAAAFIDVDSIRRDGDRVTFWREVRWPTAQRLSDGTRFDRIANLYEADCRAMRFRSLQVQARLETEVILGGEEEGEEEVAEPGSTAEVDLRAACFDSWPQAQ